MSRILFSVCGVGLGHASRSSIIIRHLQKKKHELEIVSYSDGLEFLKKSFPKVHRIEWFDFKFKNAKIDKFSTLLNTIPKLPKVVLNNYKVFEKILAEFNPDLIISDFDINALLVGKHFKIPVILVSNMHLIEFKKLKLRVKEKLEFKLTDERMVKAFKGADYYLVTSLAKPKEKIKNMFFYHPIVEEKIAKAKPKTGNYNLIYLSGSKLEEMLSVLKQFPQEKFVVYGKNIARKEGNFVFRKYSYSGMQWLNDIKNCEALISHGGMLTLSEAVVLKKPCFVLATPDWFERYHNGMLSQELGFGKCEKKASVKALQEFFHQIPKFRKKLKEKNVKPANKEFLKKLDSLIAKFA